MIINDKDNIYVYREEDEDNIDDSPLNYASSDLNENDDDIETNSKAIRKKSAFLLLVKIMFFPVQGWKNLRREHPSIESIQSGCFYPILACLSISKFADYLYSVNVTLSSVITEAVVAFVSYFFGYFCILIILSKFLPRNTEKNFDTDYGKEYVIIGLSTLALFSIITELLPMLWPILIFLPLWTLYLLYRGSRFFKIAPNQELKFMIVICCSIIGVPLLIEWGLNELLPY